MIAARRGGGSSGGVNSDTKACGGGGWSPSSILDEQSHKMEISPFLSQMTARVCGGSLPLL